MPAQLSEMLGRLRSRGVKHSSSGVALAATLAALVLLAACGGSGSHTSPVQPLPMPTGVAHGMFILDPPVNDNNCNGIPANCFSQHLVPTLLCNGSGSIAGVNCSQVGAGQPFVKGAAFHVGWNIVNPSDGQYDFSAPDRWIQTWGDAGKSVSLVFEPTSFGTTNKVSAGWYMTPVPIASAAQTNGIITLHTTSPMSFFPGGATAAAGLEIQIMGTGTALDSTKTNPGIYSVCDHTGPTGCLDPTSTTITAVGSGNDIAAVLNVGTVGNPVYGSNDGSTCISGILPIQWRKNFIKAWQNVLQNTVAHYGAAPSVAYLRFGMGIGGQTNPTNGLSAQDSNQAACQAQMTEFGFTSVPAPWPAPETSGWSSVAANWTSYLQGMIQYEKSLSSPKAIIITISPIQFSPVDHTTPDATATSAAAARIGFGNQGLQKSDITNFDAKLPCYGGDWCANFQKYKGQVPLELQTLSFSDPTNTSQTGSLVNLLPFATSMGTDILELYMDDWMCSYDTTWNGNNAYAACNSAGYPGVFSSAASILNN